MFLVWTNYSWRRHSTGGGDERSLACSPCPGRLLGATLTHQSAWNRNSRKLAVRPGTLRLALSPPRAASPALQPGHRNGGEDDYERHYDSVDELGSQGSSRLTQQLGKQLLNGLVPGQRGHESQSERDQLGELVQHFGAQLLLLLPYLGVVDFCGHAGTVQADPCVHLKPAGMVEGDTASRSLYSPNLVED